MKFLIAGVAGLLLPAAAHAETACAELIRTSLPHAEVTAAKVEALKSGPVCRISVTSRPTPDSDIRSEVWIPMGPAWNGKFVQVGNGGLAGAIPTPQIRLRAEAGYAAAGTDDGHQARSNTASWALGHPEKIRDFGIRALKATTDAGKALVAAMKGEAPRRSYFVGCSAGGREALMEAQRFPDDFDGVVAGAPANYNTLSTGGRAYIQQMLARPGGYLGLAQLQLLQAAALKQCGDGGAFIRDQMACRFDPSALACRTGKASDGCLTAPQIATARAIYAGRPDPRGHSLFPGYMPGGEALKGGYQTWSTGSSQATISQASGYAISSQVMKYLVYDDPAFDFLKADLGAKFDRDRLKLAAILDATDPDLTRFKARGGKLIQYHGWNDPAIPPLGSVRYYGEVKDRMGDTSGFYRLYMVPGMLHCQGGAGPALVDWLGLLDRWVEAKAAPAEVIATSAAGGSQLLCPYPGVAKRVGKAYACPAHHRRG